MISIVVSHQVPKQPDDNWIAEHYPRVRRTAWMLTGDLWSTEDLVQETFLRAIQKWNSFDGQCSDSTWLTAILFNVHRSQRRTLGRAAKRIRQWFEQKGHSEQSYDAATFAAASQWQSSIWSKVAELPAVQQQAIVLRFDQECTFDEIAQVQNCAVGTAQTRVHYALRKLKPQMEVEEFFEAKDLATALKHMNQQRAVL